MQTRLVFTAGLLICTGCTTATHHSWSAVDAIVARQAAQRAGDDLHCTAASCRADVDVSRGRGRVLPSWPCTGGVERGHSAYGTSPMLLSDLGDEAAGSDEPSAHTSGRHRAPLPGLWDTIKRDVKSLPSDLWSDTKAVYISAPNLIILGAAYGGSLALQESGPDDSIEASLRRKRIFKSDVSDALGALGNPITHFGLAGLWYLVGQQSQNEKTYEVGRTMFSALIISGLTTTVGKVGTWDRSPNGELFAFPSGHTSSAFAFASVMHEAYGPMVGAPLYALGVLVAVERLDDEEHYFSDVVMGAVIGLVVGHGVAGEHELRVFGGRIVPFVDTWTGASGIAWHYEF
jgi:hypothetical protein